MENRLNLTKDVLRKLFALSGNECAFPDCSERMILEDGTYIGQICHIEAAKPGGQRYNENQTEEERRGFDNLLVMCYKHHKITDDVTTYTIERLRQIKKDHEDRFRNIPRAVNDNFIARVISIELEEFDKLYGLTEETNRNVKEIKTMVEGLQSVGMGLTVDLTSYFIEDLNAITSLRAEGKIKTLLDQLIKFRENKWAKASEEIRYKVIVQSALCYFDLQQKVKGAKALKELAYNIYPSPNRLPLLVLGYAILGDKEEFDACFPKAFADSPGDLNLWHGYIDRYRGEKSTRELKNDLPAEILNAPKIQFLLGQRIIEEGLFEEGFAMLNDALKTFDATDRSWADYKAHVASYIIGRMANDNQLVYSSLTSMDRTKLQEARDHLSASWECFKDTELVKSKWHIVMNLGVVNKVLGQLEDAKSNFFTAINLNKGFLPFKNMVMLLLQEKKLMDAQQLLLSPSFEPALTKEDKFDLVMLRFRLLSLMGNIEEAVTLLSVQLDDANEAHYIEICSQISSLYLDVKSPEKATWYAQQLKEKFPDYIGGYLLSGMICQQNDNAQLALLDYDKADALISSRSPVNEIFQLAYGYSCMGEHVKAILLFERIVDPNVFNDYSKRLLHAYFITGNIQQARNLAEQLYVHHPKVPIIIEILSKIYSETRNYDMAIKLIEGYLPHVTGGEYDFFAYQAAINYAKIKDWENVKRLALSIISPLELGMNEIFRLSHVLALARQEDYALELAFEARNGNLDNGDAHQQYLTILTQIQREQEELTPGTISVECVVIVSMENGQEHTYVISARHKLAGYLKPEDALAKKLIGKRVGDTVTLRQNLGIERTLAVKQIINIYQYAFQESLGLFETRFEGKNNFVVFHSDPQDPGGALEKVIREITTSNTGHKKRLFDYYNQQIIGLGALSNLLVYNPVELWFSLLSSPDVYLNNYSSDEMEQLTESLNEKRALIIDLTSLLTNLILWPEMNLFSRIQGKYYVAQSTIDHLQSFYDDFKRNAKEGILRLGVVNNEMISEYVEPQSVQDLRENIATVIDWCKKNTTIVKPKAVLNIDRKEREDKSKALGVSFYETLLIAEELNGGVISDDAVYKRVLKNHHSISGFSIYQVARMLLQNGQLTLDKFEGFSYKLISSNYIFIPVTDKNLWASFDAAGFSLKKPFLTAVKGLLILLPVDRAKFVVAFFKQLYLNAGLSVTRLQTVQMVLRELSCRNDYDVVKNLLLAEISVQFNLLPEQRLELFAYVRDFNLIQ